MLIQITADSDDSLVTPITIAAGDEILLDADAAITATNDAVIGSAGANGTKMTFLGSVQSGGWQSTRNQAATQSHSALTPQ